MPTPKECPGSEPAGALVQSTMPDDAKNEIKKALAYKRLQEQRHRPYGKISGPEEIVKLWRESRFEEASEAILTTDPNKVLAQQCPECRRIFAEH